MDSLDPILAGLTPPQAEAAMHDGAILVLAGAGILKTRNLTSEVAWRIARHGIPANRVLTVTFTNKAAADMATRPGQAGFVRQVGRVSRTTSMRWSCFGSSDARPRSRNPQARKAACHASLCHSWR